MKWIPVIAMLVLTTGLGAQEAARNEALGFSRISPDPQAAAMGYAGRASTGGSAWAAFENPGRIPFQGKTVDAGGSWMHWAPEGENATVYGAGAAVRIGRRFGLTGGFLQSRSPLDPDLDFAPADRHIAVGAALAVSGHVAAAISYHALRSELLGDYALEAGAVDLLLTGDWEHIRLTGGVAGLGSLVQGNIRTPLATSVVLAGEWHAGFGGQTRQGIRHAVRADADLDYFPASRSLTAAVGAEYGLAGIVFLRGGYHLAAGKAPVLPSFASLGAGLSLNRSLLPFLGRTAFRLDLAWLTASPILGNGWMLSAAVEW